jgi:hypothetical protein
VTTVWICGVPERRASTFKKYQRKKRERLCRCINRPAISEKRLSLTGRPVRNAGQQLKRPYRESAPRERTECLGRGTTHVSVRR